MVFFSAFVFKPEIPLEPEITVQLVEVEVVDPRIEKLEVFFRRYKCPQPYYIEQYLEIADKYDLPYSLLPTLSLKESTCGKQVFRKNNHWGFGYMSFDSVDAGIEYVGDKLTNGKYYRGKGLEDKLRTYNSVSKGYVGDAISLMQDIEN